MTGRYDNRAVKILRETRCKTAWICIYIDSVGRGRPRTHGKSPHTISKNLIRLDFESIIKP